MNIKLLEMTVEHGPSCITVKLLVDEYRLDIVVKPSIPGRNNVEIGFSGELGNWMNVDHILEFVGKLFINLADHETGARKFIIDEGQTDKNRDG